VKPRTGRDFGFSLAFFRYSSFQVLLRCASQTRSGTQRAFVVNGTGEQRRLVGIVAKQLLSAKKPEPAAAASGSPTIFAGERHRFSHRGCAAQIQTRREEMKVMRNLRVMGLLGAMVLAALVTAGAASAKCIGHFTLSSETRWGDAILPPGHYTFELDGTNDLITVRGQKRAFMVMAWNHDDITDKDAGSSALILVSRGGKRTVRALRLAPEKEVFFYAVPKETPKVVAQGPVLIERVPITINGN
jgi:hypothetical protein